MYYKNPGYRVFYRFNVALLIAASFLCLVPLIHIFALSLSSGSAASANMVGLWPVDFTWNAYTKTIKDGIFLNSITISIIRVLAGVVLGMLVVILTAYPLSKMDHRAIKGRKWLAWYFIFPMLFGGGLIPSYIVYKYLGLINSFWVLILPMLVSTWNIILLMNFFRNTPRELEESSMVDGAGHFRTLFSIFIPISMPALATLSLFSAVGHWNSWFDGLVFLSEKDSWPLSTYLQTILVTPDPTKVTIDEKLAENFSQRTIKSAQIFIGSLPILLVYPFLQRYFVKGIVLGAVKE